MFFSPLFWEGGEAFSQSGQKYATGGNNLDSDDKLGSKNFAPLRFFTDDTERARFTETGLLGIGTAAPSATLTVNGTFKFTDGSQQNGYVLTSDGNGLATWQSLSSNTTGLWQQSGSDIFYNTGNVSTNNELFVGSRLNVANVFEAKADTVKVTSPYSAINSNMFCISGQMGVGGVVPSVALDVDGSFNLTGDATVGGNLNLTGIAQADTSDQITLLSIDTAGKILSTSIGIEGNQPNCFPYILWAYNQPSVTSADVILCPKDRKVGIGTHAPKAKLHSEGSAYFGPDNGFTNNGFLEVYSPTGDNLKAAQFENDNGSRVFIVPQLSSFGFSNLSKPNDIGIIWSDNANGFNQNVGLVLAPHGTTQGMRITSDGNVGVGTADPEAQLHVKGTVIIGNQTQTTGPHTDYQLAVDGKIVSKKSIVTLDNWADFVYSKKYNRPTIEQKNAFGQQYKHLMYLPSEKEIVKNGMDVGQTMKGLTRHIEEQELDIYSLHKRLEKLEHENKALKAEIETLKQ